MDDLGWGSRFPSCLDARDRRPHAVKRELPEDAAPRLFCDACGGVEFDSGDDGFYYCRLCGSQSQDVVDTGYAEEDVFGDAQGSGALYHIHRHRAQKHSQDPAAPAISKDDVLRSLSKSLAAGSGGAVKKEQEKALPYGFEDEPSEPRDFGAGPCLDAETLARGIRLRYVQGLQVILQLQCEALVEKFGVSPLICGLAGTIWLRFVASSMVFDEGWGQKVIAESEAAVSQSRDDNLVAEVQRPAKHTKAKYVTEPRNAVGRRAIYIWLRALRKTIPVYSSLAISVLACHIAREAILPTDIVKWASEAKLPYLTAFLVLDKYLGSSSNSCPLSSRLLFRPVRVIGSWQLEAVAGSIAQKIGLNLPSVNFYAIASRYLKDLSLPTEKILPQACRLYEWSIPADLWLSCNTSRLPTRVCVMAILIVTVRILYNIHGQGFWEMTLLDASDTPRCQTRNPDVFSLSPAGKLGDVAGGAKGCCFTTNSSTVKNMPSIKSSDFNTKELLDILQAAHDKISTAHDYSRDLRSYLKYSQDVVFAGMTTSYDEQTLIERFWEIYDKQEDDIQQEGLKDELLDSKGKRQREVPATSFFDFKRRERSKSSQHINRERSPDDYGVTTSRDGFASNSADPNEKDPLCNSSLTPSRNAAVERMKLSMEENGFYYLPPRVQKRTDGYLHYKRKRLDGKLICVAHADYYIVLRACAKIAQVDMRMMHLGSLKFERRLAWIEQRIDSSLNTLPQLLHQMQDN
ncbi:RNA polymerase I-specific transcription initiation factor Rrn7 [Musa troglodytarum]|uniref:RNA polymerase I-specific transcription initiation factor Rrn7 n=1 Tax=Musa troglodytarum TaxID=320322 RepID=A0A9E7JT41_9LILI|nr:RNA polymerase I-specific transcription initiation factor Rrn7 [Musa troglodytarum]